MNSEFKTAPALQVSHWFNTLVPICLPPLRGKVVVVHAFQMLCPARVATGLPQARHIQALFSERDIVVIGLHTVFEHHAVMGADSLEVFVHAHALTYSIGIDQPCVQGNIPLIMQAYGLRGTPSLVVLDRLGRIRLNHFGHIDDLRIGALLGQLVAEKTRENGL